MYRTIVIGTYNDQLVVDVKRQPFDGLCQTKRYKNVSWSSVRRLDNLFAKNRKYLWSDIISDELSVVLSIKDNRL